MTTPIENAPSPSGGSPPAPDLEEAEPATRRHRRRRWPVVAAVLVGTVLVGLGSAALLFATREDPQERPLDEAVEAFRGEAPSAEEDRPGRPPAGVYPAEGDGLAELSFPPVSQRSGPSQPVTVRHEPGGCWTLTVDYNEAHAQSWRACPGERPGLLVETGGETSQRWDLGFAVVENVSSFRCDPPVVLLDAGAAPGQSWPQACEGTSTGVEGTTSSAGSTTFVGTEVLTVGAEPVELARYRQERLITGAQTGEQTLEVWLASDGLVVRAERTVRVESASPVGVITYTESGAWQLASLEPEG